MRGLIRQHFIFSALFLLSMLIKVAMPYIFVQTGIRYHSKVWSKVVFMKLLLLFYKDTLNRSIVTVKTFIMLQKINAFF